jgi:hypothetical protein
MGYYVNIRPLEDLFSDVELKPDAEARLTAIRLLESTFVRLTVTALERIAYDLAEKGWTARQIADEIGVGRDHVARMAGAYATREGHLSPFPSSRRYDHAVDLRALVRAEARRQAAPLPPDPSDSASPTTA